MYCKFGIFARVLFLRNFAYAKFLKNKILAHSENPLSFTDKENHALVVNYERRKYVF